MSGGLQAIFEEARSYSVPEIIAVAAAIAYLVLAIRQNIWCWVCAAISTAIYVYLFIDARLYMESVLNLFYFAMAIYGWHMWTRGHAKDAELPVTRWPVSAHIIALLVLATVSALNGLALASWTDAAWPYVDSATTWSAIWATFLVARKVLENWWYWLVIDFVSMLVYWERDLELTAVLFLLYLLMIPFGYTAWRRSMSANG